MLITLAPTRNPESDCMYVFSVATRYLLRRPMSYVATAIIVLIVVLYLLIISVMEGFKGHYMTKLQSIFAHMTVRIANDPGGIVYPERWSKELAQLPGVKGITIGLEIPAIVIADKSRTVGTLRGIDLDEELRLGKLKEILKPQSLAEFGRHDAGGKTLQGCIAGGAWKRTFNLKLGDHLTFLFTDDAGDPRAVAFVVVGFYEGQNDYLENAAYVDRRFLAKQIQLPDYAKTLSVWIEGDADRPDLDSLRANVDEKMRELLKRDASFVPEYLNGLAVETWREKDFNLYHAISRENQIMRFIMGVFLLFVIIIVMLILGQLVAEKTRDIGVLRAMGATPQGISGCFLLQGLLIACVGLLLGLPAALLFIDNVNEIAAACGINVFPSSAFLVDRIPAVVLPKDVLLISALTLAAGILGAAIPALRAARLNPVESLRRE